MKKIRSVTIFEGPDCAGKTTLAEEYACQTGAFYVHHGPYLQVKQGLEKIFTRSMLPALIGYQDVVLDRCWISEPIYANAFRNGESRLTLEQIQAIEGLAICVNAVVIKCLPPWNKVQEIFDSRKSKEYLTTKDQLRAVYNSYKKKDLTRLDQILYDFTRPKEFNPVSKLESKLVGIRESILLNAVINKTNYRHHSDKFWEAICRR